MIKYALTEGSIKDNETGAFIPFAEGNRHYQEYLQWVKEGNTPIPKQPSQFHKLVNDEWVLDSEEKERVELEAEQEALIQEKMRKLVIDSLKIEGKLSSDFVDKKEK